MKNVTLSLIVPDFVTEGDLAAIITQGCNTYHFRTNKENEFIKCKPQFVRNCQLPTFMFETATVQAPPQAAVKDPKANGKDNVKPLKKEVKEAEALPTSKTDAPQA